MVSRLRSRTDSRPLSVRALAAQMNECIVAGRGTVEGLMAGVTGVDARDTALLRALVSGSLRWHHRLQWIVGQLVDRPRQRVEPVVAALIRIGLLQLTELRIPEHAAVAATVAAATELGRPRAKGFVNAILRRYLREPQILEGTAAPVARYSHPEWLIDVISNDWPEHYAEILEANNARAPLWVRVNATKMERDDYRRMLYEAGIEAQTGAAGPAAVKIASPLPAAELPGFREGLVSVQDAAAQLAAPLVGPRPGERILDACAAPGGKATHLLELCPRLGELVALDRDPARLERVEAELARLGVAATVSCADALDVGAWWDGRPFERILLDAPCSSTGVIRRHPEIKVLRTPDQVASAARVQARLLEALWPLLAPGGRMVYATCSVLDIENVSQVRDFLGRHKDASCARLGSPTHFRVQTGAADMDGFYYACLDRR